MHRDLREALRSTIRQILQDCRERVCSSSEIFVVWKRGRPGQWTGSYEHVPAIGDGFYALPWSSYAQEIDRLLKEHHSDHCGLVGSEFLGRMNLDTEHKLRVVVSDLWRVRESFEVDPSSVDELLDGVSKFMDASTIEIEFIAPLLNFSAPAEVDVISLNESLRIRRLTDEEVNRIFGGRQFPGSGFGMRQPSPLEWGLAGTITDQKVLGQHQETGHREDRLHDLLSVGVLVLRTYRAGPVGFDFIRLRPRRSTPFVSGEMSRWRGDTYVPWGSYVLTKDDLPALQLHGSLLTGGLHPSLETGCARLSDAEIRLQPRDKLFDAVVGLEAILLASRDPYQGELRYRFATNYAAMWEPPSDRFPAFLLARKLYDLRSDIAHGSPVPAKVQLPSGVHTVAEVATQACEILRSVIRKFLPEGRSPSYLAKDYWPRRIFPGG